MKKILSLFLSFTFLASFFFSANVYAGMQQVAPKTATEVFQGTKYIHKYVTLKLGATYSGTLDVKGLNITQNNCYSYGSNNIIEFTSRNGKHFTIKAVGVGTTCIYPHYTKITTSLGGYSEGHWGADEEEILHVSVIGSPIVASGKLKQNGHTYQIFEANYLSWEAAEAYCNSIGGHLAAITSMEENNFIAKYLKKGHYYIGGTDAEKEADWKWVTGEPFTFFNWSPNEPNNLMTDGPQGQPYLLMYGPTAKYPLGKWDDCWGKDGHAAGFVCEWNEEISDESICVSVNDQAVYFDQPPVMENNRTLVPLRAVFEAMGAVVKWEDSTQTITVSIANSPDDTKKIIPTDSEPAYITDDIIFSSLTAENSKTVLLNISSNEMYINGTMQTIDVPAKLINSRTYVPVRAISEAFGCKVDWNEETKTVIITQ